MVGYGLVLVLNKRIEFDWLTRQQGAELSLDGCALVLSGTPDTVASTQAGAPVLGRVVLAGPPEEEL